MTPAQITIQKITEIALKHKADPSRFLSHQYWRYHGRERKAFTEIVKMLKTRGHSQRQIAERFGKDRSTISYHLAKI